MLKFVVSSLWGVARFFAGDLKVRPDSELGPHGLWLRAAEACSVENLVSKRIAFLAPPRIEGARPPLGVSILPQGAAGSANATLVVKGVERAMEVRHESLRTRLLGGSEITVGDPAFDAEFFVQGDPLFVRAALDASTRALALELFGPRPSAARELLLDDGPPIGVGDGELVARFVDRYPHAPITPEERLGQALELGGRLLAVRLEERLARVALEDPLASVRVAALETLHEARPREDLTHQTLTTACGDVEPHVRLAAAVRLGLPAGKRTLLGLASRTNVSDALSARAVTELRSHLPAGQARDILAEALRERRLETAVACLDTLGRLGSHADVAARVLSLEEGPVAVAAARALMRCGTPADIALLREVESRHPRTDPLPLACRAAIGAIHARQPGASPGQLALADDPSGRLSPAAAEGGEVSVVPPHERRR